MTVSTTRTLMLVAALSAAPLAALPAVAQDGRDAGVSVTIRKAPSYLNTRTTPNPGSATLAARETSAYTQSSTPNSRIIGFDRSPLPNRFDLSF